MVIDKEYFENKVVKLNEDGVIELTGIGYAYGAALAIVIYDNKRRKSPKEYEDVADCDLPEDIMLIHDGMIRFDKKGFDWTLDYISKHKLNKRIYDVAVIISGGIGIGGENLTKEEADIINPINVHLQHGLVRRVEQNFELTLAGIVYGTTIISSIMSIKDGNTSILRYVKNLEMSEVSNDVFNTHSKPGECPINDIGKAWVVDYMSTHKFNPSIYEVSRRLATEENFVNELFKR